MQKDWKIPVLLINVIIKRTFMQHVGAWDKAFLFLMDLQLAVEQTCNLDYVYFNI